MERIMAVVSREKKFAERLCEYVNRKSNLAYTAVPFGNMESCAGFGRKHKIEMLLADRDMAEGREVWLRDSLTPEITLLLDDSAELYTGYRAGENSESPAVIRKYQPAEDIVRSIIESCVDKEVRRTSAAIGRPVRVVGVYSPSGGSGCSSFAIALSRLLNASGKTLYLNLNEFSGISSLTGEQCENGISDLLYHMKQQTLTPEKILAAVRSFEGIDYIPPLRFADDRSAVSGEEYVKLVNAVLKNTAYDAVVLCMQSYAGEASELMELCETVYIPCGRDRMSILQVTEFEEYLRASGRQTLTEKVVRAILPEEIPSIPMGTYIDSLMFGPLGDLVRGLEAG